VKSVRNGVSVDVPSGFKPPFALGNAAVGFVSWPADFGALRPAVPRWASTTGSDMAIVHRDGVTSGAIESFRWRSRESGVDLVPEPRFALPDLQVLGAKSAQRRRENWGQAKASDQCAGLIWERSHRATVLSCFAAGLSGAAASQ
jgi:hypothetical protein